MEFEFSQNRVNITLSQGETFFLRGRSLRGVKDFDWRFLPPFPLGSPIVRMFYGSYFMMREICGKAEPVSIPVSGTNPRGNFHVVRLAPGEKFYVSGHSLAGFSSDIRSLHTHIKFRLQYWLLEKHFFPVFEGPGSVLLYGKSAFEVVEKLTFQPERIAAFNISRAFRVVGPQPKRLPSQMANLISTEVVWEFLEPGKTVVEAHNPKLREEDEGNALWELIKHIASFFRI